MAFEFKVPGIPEKNKEVPFSPNPEKQRAGLGSTADDISNLNDVKAAQTPKETVRFDNMQEVENAFKKGSIEWPDIIEVEGFEYNFYKSFTKGLVNILKGKKPGYVIYHIPKELLEKAKTKKLGHWMVFLFKAEGPSNIAPQGIGFTTSQRGKVIYEQEQQVVGDVVLLKLQLPSGVIALKGKVDTGADISSLHVDSTPKIVGDTVRFENHNASGNVITAPLVAKQAVKNAEGVEYRPVIELDIEVNGKRISKAQFNLNNRTGMSHEVLIGQNILEKGGFLVNPTQDKVKEGDEEEETDLMDLTEDQIDDLMMELSSFLTESEENTTED